MNDLFERFIEEGLRKHLQAFDGAIRVIGQENEHLVSRGTSSLTV
jgi:hypothetical protein